MVKKLFETSGYGEAVVRRQFSESVVEAGREVPVAGPPIAPHHRELVVVGKESQILVGRPALRDVTGFPPAAGSGTGMFASG
jgi:hypothetical protein